MSFFLVAAELANRKSSELCSAHINENSSYNVKAQHTRRIRSAMRQLCFLLVKRRLGGTLSGERQIKKIVRFHACGELQPAEPTQRVSRNWRDGLHYLCRGA